MDGAQVGVIIGTSTESDENQGQNSTAARTTIVYVVSPDREVELFSSLSSLLASASKFDQVRICCVGTPPPHWRFVDERVILERVEPLFGEYFFGNKLHLCDSEAGRVVFLDADTVVLRPLNSIWENRTEQFLARPERPVSLHPWGICRPDCTCGSWKPKVWRQLFEIIQVEEIPLFNAGLLIFQRSSHVQIRDSWSALLRSFLRRALPFPSRDTRMLEQWSLAMAVANERLSFAELGPETHAFGWMEEDATKCAVFHFGHYFWRPTISTENLLKP
jgi:hypothetical protein